jgi:tetratricopeptide (TPR) repeat protein
MKLEFTLIKYIIPMFLMSFNVQAAALSETVLAGKVEACNTALNNGDMVAANKAVAVVLLQNANHHEALLCKGRVLGAQGNYKDALTTLEQAAKGAQPGFEEIINHLLIGNLHKNNQQYAQAIASYEKSIKVCDTEKNDKFKHINLNLMGESQALNGDQNAALASYLAGSKLANNDNERADSFERLGASYSALGQHDKAIEYQLKGVIMQKKAGTLDQFANASLEMGRIYTAAKDYANAEKTLTKLAQFSKDNGGAYYEAKSNYLLAQAKLQNGDATSAKTLLTGAYSQANSIGEGALAAEIEASLKQLNK